MDVLASAFARACGWLGLAALVGSLATSLVSRWSASHRSVFVAMRRWLGLAASVLAAVHALVAFGWILEPPSAASIPAFFEGLPHVRQGTVALAILVVLTATSFPPVNARLGLRAWSALHRAVYLAAALVGLHVLTAPSVDPRLGLAVAFVLGALLLARLAPRPPLHVGRSDERHEHLDGG